MTSVFSISYGGSALSSSGVLRLQQQAQSAGMPVCDLSAHFVHLCETTAALSATQADRLAQLLYYGPSQDHVVQRLTNAPVVFTVVPRPGTISPWSSKATDIARNCGLGDVVTRLERGIAYHVVPANGTVWSPQQIASFAALVHDRMTQSIAHSTDDAFKLFTRSDPRQVRFVDVLSHGQDALEQANTAFGLALAADEVTYLVDVFVNQLKRNPTDVELMMFAQVNSEHCRHKIFNASWTLDGSEQSHSLFQMIRNTNQPKLSPNHILSAYCDNAAVIHGTITNRFFCSPTTNTYVQAEENVHILIKVETHNHPTAISPYPGAATGSGGEIRDEAAVGQGSKPKAGLVGFSVSHLNIPGFPQPWEKSSLAERPSRISSPLQIMLDAPIGGAAFNNEFGRPVITGYFRSFCENVPFSHGAEVRGYHKPIMLAGGLGNIRDIHVHKKGIQAGSAVVVLGGPCMLIGLGGGAASSMATGASDEDLDFASVQRDNAEMQRRCQEVVDRCWALGEQNPIESIHDVGAGGLSNALPELVHDSDQGASFNLRNISVADGSLSPMEIWCNESQERYVLAIKSESLDLFQQLCARERCPYAIVGTATEEKRLVLEDPLFHNNPIDLPMSALFGKPPRMHRTAVTALACQQDESFLQTVSLQECANRVLQFPGVASKSYLITIADRSVTGLVARDQMVGPWQVPVADCGVTCAGYETHAGEAMAIGERPVLAILDAAASARMAVAESLTNLFAADIPCMEGVVLSCNWMVSAGDFGEDARLYAAVHAVGMELCPALGIVVPVGKDSMSMRTQWSQGEERKKVSAPLSLIVTAFSSLPNVLNTLTPCLQPLADSSLVLIDLGLGQSRLGGAAVLQVYNTVGHTAPDLDSPQLLIDLLAVLTRLRAENLIHAYHDRSDGGLFATVVEMAFAGHCGVAVCLDSLGPTAVAALFSEELGVVLQVNSTDVLRVRQIVAGTTLEQHTHTIGRVLARNSEDISFVFNGQPVLQGQRSQWHQLWAETSYHMQSLRDNATCAKEEFDGLADNVNPGLHALLNFDVAALTRILPTTRPRIAILREQGVNGHVEMAAAFFAAGFECHDVHMSDIIGQRVRLESFVGIAACGGFSYGDVLGAGGGWAKSILHNEHAREEFRAFFHRLDTFALGICNGCQFMSQLKELIPGADHFPRFVKNECEAFEARFVMVEVQPSPSIFLSNMAGCRLPIVVSHGEGRAEFADPSHASAVSLNHLSPLRFVDNYGQPTQQYPFNPNGSPDAITAITSQDGRVTIAMPHPERIYRTVANSWHPESWGELSPWFKMFANAYAWTQTHQSLSPLNT